MFGQDEKKTGQPSHCQKGWLDKEATSFTVNMEKYEISHHAWNGSPSTGLPKILSHGTTVPCF